MKLPSVLGNRGPGLRAGVLCMAAGLVVLAAFLVSANVSDHVAATATTEAVRSAEAVVRADVDPLVTGQVMTSPTVEQAAAVNAQLSRLVASRQILRIKIWSPTGTVLFSDLPALRGGTSASRTISATRCRANLPRNTPTAASAENVFERGLATKFLSIYLPIAGPDGSAVGGLRALRGRGADRGADQRHAPGRPRHRGPHGDHPAHHPLGRVLCRLAPARPPEPAAAREGHHGAVPRDRPAAQRGALPVTRPERGRRDHGHAGRRDDRLREPGRRTRPWLPGCRPS